MKLRKIKKEKNKLKTHIKEFLNPEMFIPRIHTKDNYFGD